MFNEIAKDMQTTVDQIQNTDDPILLTDSIECNIVNFHCRKSPIYFLNYEYGFRSFKI